MFIFKRKTLSSVLALTVCAGGAAAQDSGADSEARVLGKVEVTATRREGVTVQDAPIAVTAYDAELLEQVNFQRVNDLVQLSPSVNVVQGQSASARTNINIRGVGTSAANFGFEPSVGIFVDSVYRTRTGSGVQELPELAGVEVLRGPQGTLFGRNTSAGVVSIRTARPTQDLSGHAGVTVGNFDSLEFEGGLSGPLTDNLSARIDGRFRQRDGIITDANNPGADINNIDRYLICGQLLWEDSNTDIHLIADYFETNEVCCGAVIRQTGVLGTLDLDGPGPAPAFNGFNLIAGASGNIGVLDPATAGFREGAFSPTQSFEDDVRDWGVSLEINHDFGGVNVTSITAYRDFDSNRSQDVDFTGVDSAARDGTRNDDRVFTQELRAPGLAIDGRLDWLVGGFYLNEKIYTFGTIQLGPDFEAGADFVVASTFQGLGFPPQQFFGTIPGVPTFIFSSPIGTPVPFLSLAAGGGVPPGFTPLTFPAVTDGAGAFDTFEQTTNAFAVFTHNEFEVSDKLTLTAGLRYNYEAKDISTILTGNVESRAARNALAAGLAGTPLSPLFNSVSTVTCSPAVDTTTNFLSGSEDSRSDSEFTGTIKVSYAPTPDVLLYASYTRGFNSGGFNLDRASFQSILASDTPSLADLEFGEETVNAHEDGIKSAWFDGRMTVNSTGFFQDIQDFQQNFLTGTNFTTFGTDVESFGVEVDLLARSFGDVIV